MFINVTALKEACCGSDFSFCHPFEDVDVEAAHQLFSGRGKIMESHFAKALAPRRTHWPILDELAHILPDECIESRADVFQATGWNTAPVQILPDRGQDDIFKFAKVITVTTDRAVSKAPQDIVKLAASRAVKLLL